MNNVEAQVKFLRLNNGEDVISFAYYVPEDDVSGAHYILNDPMKIVYMTTSKGSGPFMTISLMQWVFSRISNKQEFKIEERDVLFAVEPTDNLVEYYYETVDHFNDMKETQEREIEFDSEFEDEYERAYDDAEGLQLIQDMLKQTSDKKKLH